MKKFEQLVHNKRLLLSVAIAFMMSFLCACETAQAPAETNEDEIKYTSRYNIEVPLQEAMQKMDNNSGKAKLISGIPARDNIVALTFEGDCSQETLRQILNLLDTYNLRGNFFISSITTVENPELLAEITARGHLLAPYNIFSYNQLATLTDIDLADPTKLTDLTETLIYSSVIFQDIVGQTPTLVKCNIVNYLDPLLSVISACGFERVVESDYYLNYQSFTSYEMALGYIMRLPEGSVLTFKLSGYLGEAEFNKHSDFERRIPSALQPPKIPATVPSDTSLSESEQQLQVLEWIFQAIKQDQKQTILVESLPFVPIADPLEELEDLEEEENQLSELDDSNIWYQYYITDSQYETYEAYRTANNGKLVSIISPIHTTERAVAYTFYGISNTVVLGDVLEKLSQINAQGTFFVSVTDIESFPDSINKIIAGNHEIGIAVIPMENMDFFEACHQIYRAQVLLEKDFNLKAKLIQQPYGEANKATREAASAMDMMIISPSVPVVQGKDEYQTNTAILINDFKRNHYSLSRGEIIYFRMDFYRFSNQLIAELVHEIKTQVLDNIAYPFDVSGTPSQYNIKGVYALLTNDKMTYTYPLPNSAILPQVRNRIHSGYLAGKNETEILNALYSSYIGTPSVEGVSRLPGFTEEQVINLDTVGKINVGNTNTIFLTFDDWGNDDNVNQLLAVLNKHDVKATFFILTQYVNANPNLLRAIGMEGHDIASHTVNHVPLAIDNGNNAFISISEEEDHKLYRELIDSYNAMQQIVGDIQNEKGNPVLQPFFRPPTLAVSRLGLEAAVDSGYHYIVNGDFNSGDYEATSAGHLKSILQDGIFLEWEDEGDPYRKISAGSIIVLHIGASAKYTPQAIDEFLTENAQQPAEIRFNFARLSDYLK